MNTQKREARIGNRVDERSHHMAFLRAQQVIVASERNDAHIALVATHAAKYVGLQAPTGNDIVSRNFALCAALPSMILGTEHGLLSTGSKCDDFVTRHNFSAVLLYLLRISLGHFRKVNNSSLRRIDGFDTRSIGL